MYSSIIHAECTHISTSTPLSFLHSSEPEAHGTFSCSAKCPSGNRHAVGTQSIDRPQKKTRSRRVRYIIHGSKILERDTYIHVHHDGWHTHSCYPQQGAACIKNVCFPSLVWLGNGAQAASIECDIHIYVIDHDNYKPFA